MTLASGWQPSASLDALRQRAQVLQQIRTFFTARQVMEVETPILSEASITDVHLGWLECHWQPAGMSQPRRLFLHTSPEFPMKRLLCAGSGDIYQLGKVFRDDDAGRFHNPEFTMLEWYRLGFDHHDLMCEVDALLRVVLKSGGGEFVRYRECFERVLNINPFTAELSELQRLCQEKAGYSGEPMARDECLQLLFAYQIEPTLGHQQPCFVFGFPASQAALARIDPDNPDEACRFEVYVRGVELANGFHELSDADEQLRRFQQDNEKREQLGKPTGNIDRRLIDALHAGLPECAGVALGVDRLIMLASGAEHIEQVISFPINRA